SGSPFVIYLGDFEVDTNSRFKNALRTKQTMYPNERMIHFTFGSDDSISDRLSRVDKIQEDTSGMPNYELSAYSYNGIGRLVESKFPGIEVKLDFFQGTDGTYAGYDRFGRVKDHRWADYATGSPPDIARVKHGYDAAGNRVWREDVIAASYMKQHDEQSTPGGLRSLVACDRGLLNVGKTAISGTPAHTEEFALDQLGNWTNYKLDDGGTPLDQDRTHNNANEIQTTDVWQNPAHARAGN